MAGAQRDCSLGEGVYFLPEDYIGFRRRLVIWLVDLMVVCMLLALIKIVSVSLTDEQDMTSDFVGQFCAWAYLTVLRPSRVRTVGYWVTGARIVNLQGTRPSVFRMTYRLLLNLYSPFNLLYDLLWVGVDQDRQSLTDRFAGTCVVRRKSQPAGRSEIHLVYYTALMFIYYYPRVVPPREIVEVNEPETILET
ncbi:RDD family protein [Gimesia sp.]|uniref:RDD family protein n=1 Tax=Gimesia sp. TaxID=2024833 RepID=UPI000C45CBCE|nr:RDD family protein [Gimesia sp.]MAX40313.1 hypothetical protein [Gimesia sp.]HAH47201.1 RDD family protein [Planctomycetaceae bacterium]HBL42521.1 RDD family protein [Planctomycetaceae bacterium]|tara:strand:+ start:10886 stop:11464 length:579 start_codon:yes stop_codon:yes gene_type:complete